MKPRQNKPKVITKLVDERVEQPSIKKDHWLHRFLRLFLKEEKIVNLKYTWNYSIKKNIQSYIFKTFIVVVFALFYLMILHLLKFTINWLNFLAAISIYFLIEDQKSFILKLYKSRGK